MHGFKVNRWRTFGVTTVVVGLAAVSLSSCSSGGAGTPSTSVAGSTTTAAGATGSAASASAGGSASAQPTASPSRPSSTRSAAPKPVGPAGGAVPAGFTPYSSTFVSAADGWVLGSAPCAKAPCGSVARTTDGGKSWHGIPAPKASVRSFGKLQAGDVSILRFADRSNGWAAGRAIYVTHDGGATWRVVHVGPSTGTVVSLETGGGWVYALIQGCPPSGAGACPKTAQVYAAKVGSDSWKSVSSALKANREALLVVHGATWYLPSAAGILRASGTSTPKTSPDPCAADHSDGPLLAVADAQHLDALCERNGTAGGTEIQLYGSTDAGQHWKKAGVAARMVPDQLTGMADNGHGVLLISTASGTSVILRSTDDGGLFHEATVSAPTGGFTWADLGFTTTSQAAVTLPGHGLYLSYDIGKSWSRVTF